MRLIGLTGLKRSGKDTFARHLVERHGFASFAFADPLREMALALDPLVAPATRLSWAVESLGWEKAKDTVPEVRRTLQRLGTEVVRDHIGTDVWLDLASRRLEQLVTLGHERVVVTDCRFPNEAEWIQRRGGELVRLVRTSPSGLTDLHPSEQFVNSLPAQLVIHARDVEELHSYADRLATGPIV